MKAVLAERLSYIAEARGLLPQNHFGARRRRSAEQTLLVLQKRIYSAWRNKKVLSLLSFDVKGAYNGVLKERLCQRLRARGIPIGLTRWVEAFYSQRSASIVVNGQELPTGTLENPGLPQGSPLSPILFLFYNADLISRAINENGGSIAFVDDYTVWVTGSSAAVNNLQLNEIIKKAVA
jgi:Reverse transcriptase (RNA-dependent DNA polymerase)